MDMAAGEGEGGEKKPRIRVICRGPAAAASAGAAAAAAADAEEQKLQKASPPCPSPFIVRLPLGARGGVRARAQSGSGAVDAADDALRLNPRRRRPLGLTTPEMVQKPRRRVEDGERATAVVQDERLVLVLDLDHTLLHSLRVCHLSPQETYLLDGEPPGRGGEGGSRRPLLHNLESTIGFLTKLRPFVHTFLREARSMFRLRICTMADRSYAREMARILDPDGIYFCPGLDIVSREDFTKKGQKDLDLVRHGDQCNTVILDDTVAVWGKHQDNLIAMPAYRYFAHSRRKRGGVEKSLAELRKDEDEATGALAATLRLLRWIHSMFFHPSTSSGGSEPAPRDVRDILRCLKRKRKRPVQLLPLITCSSEQ